MTVPAKITSYMAAGRPCLVAIDGEGSRVVDEAECGFTSAAGDAKALFDNLIHLADLPKAERAEMGAHGRAYFMRHFKRNKLLQQLECFILD